jgi:cyclase
MAESVFRPRVIPTLLLDGPSRLVKTRRFKDPIYIGDPMNALKIFNEKEVDEVAVLDIRATPEERGPAFDYLADLAGECFMPLAYGGGITKVEQALRLVRAGFEKIILGAAASRTPGLVKELARQLGSQSVVVAVDVRDRLWRGPEVVICSGKERTGQSPADYARRMQELGAGELLLTSVEREGMYKGYDMDLVRSVVGSVTIPVVASGGARDVPDLGRVVKEGGAAAAAAGSLFVYFGSQRGVLINFPEGRILDEVMSE